MKFYFYILIILFGFFFWDCSNCDLTKKENKLVKKAQNIDFIAREKFNGKYNTINNHSGNYAIVIHKIKNPQTPVVNKQSFFIFDLISNEVIFEDEVVNSKIFWETNNIVTVSRIPGMIKKDSENKLGNKVYSFDVVSKKKK